MPEGSGRLKSDSRRFVALFKCLDDVREFVGQAAEAWGFDDKAVYQIKLATDEAFTNIVEHAYGGESTGSIECAYHASPEGIEIILHDCGKAFDPTVISEPNLKALLDERETGGLGIYFMRKLMDEVHFSPALQSGDGCNTLKMYKRKEKVA
jgi:anti-sigma regulatory factor (Ser/Thr protein kinase)